MLMELSDSPVKSHDCGQCGDSLGATVEKRPNPKWVEVRHAGGGTTKHEFIGWDNVLGWIMAEGVVGFRDGDGIILAAPHWAQKVWGVA